MIPNKNETGKNDRPNYKRGSLNPSYKEAKRQFVFVYDDTDDNRVTVNSHQKYLLRRLQIENYNIQIDGESFYDQPINNLIRQYDEIKKVSIRHVVSWILIIFKKITD